MDYASGAEQANAVRELTTLRFGFEFPRVLSEQGRQSAGLMADLGNGFGDFLLRRANRNIETVTRLMQCKSPPDVFALQAQWMRDVADDYQKEVVRVSAIHGRLFGSSWGLKGIDNLFHAMR